MGRLKHPRKEVEAALRHAEAHGWTVRTGGSHAWGKIMCPYKEAECRCGEYCIASVWSTPRNADNHASALKRVVDNCAMNRK
jgi:hypothetical protein